MTFDIDNSFETLKDYNIFMKRFLDPKKNVSIYLKINFTTMVAGNYARIHVKGTHEPLEKEVKFE